MDITPFAAKVQEAKTLLASLQDKIDIPIAVDTAAAQTKLAALNDAVKDVTSSQRDLASAIRDTNTALHYQGAAADMANSGITSMSRRLATATAWQGRFKDAIGDTNGALYRQAGALSATGLGNIGRIGLGAAGAAIGGFGLLGLTGTQWHWLISGSAEILAVVVPALVALGSAAAVAAEGATNLYEHMSSVYTATEATATMYGQTFGDAVGVARGQLQKMQTAADPAIYGILGSSIAVVNEHFSDLARTGLGVIQTFQTFSARVVTDFGPGGVMGSATDSLLAHMQGDLTGIGQFFGNLGNSILVAASQMPGLAEKLLSVLDTITRLAAGVIDLSSRFRLFGLSILTAGMAFEETQRWGGLFVGLLGRVGLASNSSKAALVQMADGSNASVLGFTHLDSMLRAVWSVIPNVIGGIGNLASKVGAKGLGAAANEAADGFGMFVSGLSSWELVGITAAAVGIGFLIDKLVTAQSAAQRLGAAMQSTVLSVSNADVSKTIAANMAVLNGQLVLATQHANALSNTPVMSESHGRSGRGIAQEISQAHVAIQQYNADLTQQQRDMINVNQGAAWIAKTFGTSLPGALAIADAANVKLAGGILGTKNAMSVQQAQIYSLMAGYKAMGQPAGVVGSDMTALAIQSGLAGTQVSKLNSAWDDFMTNITGGTSGLGGFVQSLQNIGTVVASTKNNLGEAANINLTTGQFATALTNFGQVGSQAWQNWGQVVGSTMPQILDWMRIAGSEGALSAGQFSNAVLGMVSSMTSLAAKSPVAQAQLLALVQEADPNIKTWGQLTSTIKGTGDNLNTTSKAVEQATIKMGNMSAVAAQLGNVMNQSLLATLSQATIAASGVGGAMQKYAQDIMKAGTSIKQTAGDRAVLMGDLEKLGYSAQQAAQWIHAMQAQINQLHGKTITVTTIMNAVNGGTSPGPYKSGYVMSGSTRRGYASGTSGAAAGWGWVGEAGAELVHFRGGETVIPSHVARGYADGAGGIPDIHNHFYVDGREITSAVAKRSVERQRRTGSNGLTKRTR